MKNSYTSKSKEWTHPITVDLYHSAVSMDPHTVCISSMSDQGHLKAVSIREMDEHCTSFCFHTRAQKASQLRQPSISTQFKSCIFEYSKKQGQNVDYNIHTEYTS